MSCGWISPSTNEDLMEAELGDKSCFLFNLSTNLRFNAIQKHTFLNKFAWVEEHQSASQVQQQKRKKVSKQDSDETSEESSEEEELGAEKKYTL